MHWVVEGGHEIPNRNIKTANAICGQRVARQKPLPAALGHHFIGPNAHGLHSHMSWVTLTVLRSHFGCSLHLHTAATPMRHLHPTSHSSSDGPHSSPRCIFMGQAKARQPLLLPMRASWFYVAWPCQLGSFGQLLGWVFMVAALTQK